MCIGYRSLLCAAAFNNGVVIMPIGILITFWILLKKVNGGTFGYFVFLAVVWTLIAVAFDYLFIVKALKPADG
jgi:hypothetical protein